MKGDLYQIVFRDGRTQIEPTLDLNMDIAYWSRHSRAVQLQILRTGEPWGQVLGNWGKGYKQRVSVRDRTSNGRQDRLQVKKGLSEKARFQAGLEREGMVMRLPLDGNPPSILERLGMENREEGYRLIAKAGEDLSGRCLTQEEFQRWLTEKVSPIEGSSWKSWSQLYYLMGYLRYGSGVALQQRTRARGGWAAAYGDLFPLQWGKKDGKRACCRCGTIEPALQWSDCAACGERCPYCPECLTMGRTKGCSVLVFGKQKAGAAGVELQPLGPPDDDLERWGLSPAQREAVKQGVAFLSEWNGHRQNASLNDKQKVSGRQSGTSSPPRFLIWAVTGAGKTEMIYPLIAYVLNRGGRVAVATPRRDVVMELKPRMAKAFPEVKLAALYGGSSETWESTPLVLATTHQLMRFEGAFDLLIIDELDAFPYHNDPKLAFAARKALADSGRMVYLSATPPKELERAASKGQLPHVKVPARFHGHPLPVPVRVRIPEVGRWCGKGTLPIKLKQALLRSYERGAQVFLFSPAIRYVEPLVEMIRRSLPDIPVAGTSSVDEERGDKVMAFRERRLRILVTTTILERGVTIPKSDVFILDADQALFDEAALVQMAGRAGRSPADPSGSVYFLGNAYTASQQGAIRQIRRMNRIAAKRGYLIR